MIILNILTQDQKSAEVIVADLFKNKLIYDACFKEINYTNFSSKLKFNALVQSKTKALLFKKINDRLKVISKATYQIYSVPLTNVDESIADDIISNTLGV